MLLNKLFVDGELCSLNQGSWTETGELSFVSSVVDSESPPPRETFVLLLPAPVVFFVVLLLKDFSLPLNGDEQEDAADDAMQIFSSSGAQPLSLICSSSSATSIMDGLMSR